MGGKALTLYVYSLKGANCICLDNSILRLGPLRNGMWNCIFMNQGRILYDFEEVRFDQISVLTLRIRTGLGNVDPDKTPQNVASDQGQHCCHSPNNFAHISQVVKWTC